MRALGFLLSGAISGWLWAELGKRRGWSLKKQMITGLLFYLLVVYPIIIFVSVLL